jgi:EAL domain-containing protein (putative c-di-GMP-specific phosphodiesterase class I)/FixJ family two-component response regulator
MFSTYTVIVAEDHPFQRSIAVDYLRQLGVGTVLEAEDGRTAMELMGQPDAAVDILLCDLDMPGMDGVELIRHTATNNLANSLVLLSGLDTILIDSVENMARAHNMNVLGTIEKPVSAQKLANVLTRYRPSAVPQHQPLESVVSVEELRAAIEAGEVIPYFQPKVNFESRGVVAVEALARLKTSSRGIVSPLAFIPVAERNGLIDALTWSMAGQAFRARAAWAKQGIHVKIALNLSVATLGVVGAAEKLVALAQECGILCSDAILEVTESLVTSNLAYVLENLARLRMRGFGISIDDYGTGFSSMQQLSRVPFTELKIDQSFVSGATSKPNVRAILESSLLLAKKLGLTSVAEGVEREEEWALLKSLGCDMAQGFLISRPIALEQFAQWHQSWSSQIASRTA